MAGTSDQIFNFMFSTKKPYDLGVRLRFRLYGIFMLQNPYKSGFGRTSGNADPEPKLPKIGLEAEFLLLRLCAALLQKLILHTYCLHF